MSKNNFSFSKDYLESVANAGIFSYQQKQQIIQPDELFFGIYKFIKKQSFNRLFWQFFGLKDESIIESYIQNIYQHSWQETNISNIKFQLDGIFKPFFDEFNQMGVKQLHVLSLLYMVVPKISQNLSHYLISHGLDLVSMRKKVLHIITMTQKANIPPMNFFEMFVDMTTQLGIQEIDGDMSIDIENMIFLNDEEFDEVMLSGDTKVKDRDEDEEDDDEEKEPKKKKKDAKEKLSIEYFGIDLTQDAKKDDVMPIIGRDEEIKQLMYTLLRKTKNNPLLLGEAGVGKTAIVEGLAQRIVANNVPERLKGKRIMMVDVGSLIAGTKYRGEFEARLKTIVDEAMDPANNIIMFIDEIHTIIGAGSAEGTSDAANMLKPMLARGKLQLIGATTYDEYQKYIEKDPALKRRFQELMVPEPSTDDAVAILEGIKTKFEDYHGVTIDEKAIQSAVDYSVRYMMNKYLPDKAIDLMDEASARASTLQDTLADNSVYEALEKKALLIRGKIEKCITKQDYFAAAGLKEQEEACKQKMIDLRSTNSLPRHLRPLVSSDNIAKVVAEKIGIPASQITDSEIRKLSGLEHHLESMIFGQEEAVQTVVKAIKRSRISVITPKKPIASFLFLGPSGVGKTYLAKLIATEFFGDEKAMIRVDMSEYMERFSISKLIGSAPGYVGYEEGGALTEQVRRKPYSVILFDEIEKASPDVLNVLLQIFDEGHLKDNKGRWIDFKNTIIIMTSNLGSDFFGEKMSSLGFGLGSIDKQEVEHFHIVKEKVLAEVKDFLAPELINRLSAQIVFKPLSKELMGKILKKELDVFLHHRKTKIGLKLPIFTPKKISQAVDKIYDAQYGARPIYRYIHDEVEPELIEQVIKKELEQKT